MKVALFSLLIAMALGQTACFLSDEDANLCPAPPTAAAKVFGGTEIPTAVALDAGQMLSIGTFTTCTGTLIAPTWVVTARHCELTSEFEFCVGEQSDAPNVCVAVSRVVEHPGLDVSLAELAEAVPDRLPGSKSLALLEGELDCSWMGQIGEAAGYGSTERGDIGIRLFTAEPIVALTRNTVIIDGQGQQGLCRGDSGGPVLVAASDGSPQIAGVLSMGNASCRGEDVFIRADRVREWIASVTGG